MSGEALVRACFTDSERCGPMPVVPEEATSEAGCTSAPRLRVPANAVELAQEVEAMAVLARSIGHDFNNLLSIIMSYTLLVLEDLEPGNPSRPDLEEVCRAVERAHELAGQLAALGQKGPDGARPI